MWFNTDQGLQYHILDLSMHELKAISLLLKCFLEHGEVPLGAVSSIATLLRLCIRVVVIIIICSGFSARANWTL